MTKGHMNSGRTDVAGFHILTDPTPPLSRSHSPTRRFASCYLVVANGQQQQRKWLVIGSGHGVNLSEIDEDISVRALMGHPT